MSRNSLLVSNMNLLTHIFAAWWCKPLFFSIFYFVIEENSTISGCEYVRIKLEIFCSNQCFFILTFRNSINYWCFSINDPIIKSIVEFYLSHTLMKLYSSLTHSNETLLSSLTHSNETLLITHTLYETLLSSLTHTMNCYSHHSHTLWIVTLITHTHSLNCYSHPSHTL